MQKYKNVDEFLKYKDENISLGVCVYDHILRHTGIGTTNKITFKFYYFLSVALNINQFCKKFFKNNTIHTVIQGEKQYLPASIVLQNALARNCKVYTNDGIENISTRIFYNISETYKSTSLISKEIFEYVLNNFKEGALAEGKKLIDNRYINSNLISNEEIKNPQKFDHYILVTEKNYKSGKKFSKKDLCDFYNWDSNKPIIGVFASDYYDGNFEHAWYLFKDNLTWLRSTLKYIKNIQDVNWLIKGHPPIHQKITSVTTKKEFDMIVGNCENIALFSEKFSPSCLPNIVNLAVCNDCSIGLEYPCLGIPSIVAAEGYFAGFGFTIEPKSQEEYFSYLKNIKDLIKIKLSKDQVEKAIVYFYTARVLTKLRIPLLPSFDISRNLDERKFWLDLTQIIKNYDPNNDYFYKMLKKQIEEKSTHTLDYSKINSLIS